MQPAAALFSAQMRPWWPATISRQMASPRPVPPLAGLRLARLDELVEHGLQFVGRNSRPFVADADQQGLAHPAHPHVDGPSGGENFTALLKRLRITCLNAIGIDQGVKI